MIPPAPRLRQFNFSQTKAKTQKKASAITGSGFSLGEVESGFFFFFFLHHNRLALRQVGTGWLQTEQWSDSDPDEAV